MSGGTRVPADLAVPRANPEKLQRVLFNLIQNAIRHTPADGTVSVYAEPVAAGVEIEVADTGEGIAAAQRERAFEAFWMGLAVARAIVEAHGGRIWIAEAPRGTRVRFALPGERT